MRGPERIRAGPVNRQREQGVQEGEGPAQHDSQWRQPGQFLVRRATRVRME